METINTAPNVNDAHAQAKVAKDQLPWFRKKRFWALGAASLLIIVPLASSGGDGGSAGTASVGVDATNTLTPAPAAPAPAEAAQEEVAPATVSQQSAIRSAENYLSFTAFSREGLIGQLEFEDYSNDDAVFAVDTLNVDWDAQAAKKAEAYMDMKGFSRGGLIGQLEFEGFTKEQAAFGADAVGL